MENKNQIKENDIAVVIDKPDFNENDKSSDKTIKMFHKIIIIKNAKNISITGSENTIIIPQNATIYELTVHGELNSIINFNNKIVITIVGCTNNISYLTNTNKIYTALIIQGNYNNITNDGTPMISTIIGYQNNYRGVKGDRLIYYDTENENIKIKEEVIEKDYRPDIYYRV